MMTPRLLDRTTDAFRRGYRDGYEGRLATLATVAGPFANDDYLGGYAAGANEARWDGKPDPRPRASDR